MFWLDFKLFGNRWGLGSPYFDDVFLSLSGRFYNFAGGFGAQLKSIEWRTPSPGTRRKLGNREFVAFQAKRKWWQPRVMVSWAVVPAPKDNNEIEALETHLFQWARSLNCGFQ